MEASNCVMNTALSCTTKNRAPLPSLHITLVAITCGDNTDDLLPVSLSLILVVSAYISS